MSDLQAVGRFANRCLYFLVTIRYVATAPEDTRRRSLVACASLPAPSLVQKRAECVRFPI